MSNGIRIGPARSGENAGIVQVMRSGFEPDFLNLSIYGCPGIHLFVRDQIQAQSLGVDTAFTVARVGRRIVGCAEVRRLRGALFINYISVLPEYRGAGLGRRLLAAAIAAWRWQGCNRVILDVLEDNPVACNWYERLGFGNSGATTWLRIPLVKSEPSRWFAISRYPQGQAVFCRYGFSSFRLITDEAEYEIGQLGSDWFRLSKAEGVADRTVLEVLFMLDPRRALLALVKGDEPQLSEGLNARPLARTIRMETDLHPLVRQLETTPEPEPRAR